MEPPEPRGRFYDILRNELPRVHDRRAVACSTQARDAALGRAVERKAAKYRIGIWALHNYIDANRFRTRGTRSLLRATKAKIWFTETGGLVRRDNGSRIEFADSPRHAVKATRWVLKLARLSPRVRRVYFYHWVAPAPKATWDSALIDRRGKPRPAYNGRAHVTCAAAARRTASSPPRAPRAVRRRALALALARRRARAGRVRQPRAIRGGGTSRSARR